MLKIQNHHVLVMRMQLNVVSVASPEQMNFDVCDGPNFVCMRKTWRNQRKLRKDMQTERQIQMGPPEFNFLFAFFVCLFFCVDVSLAGLIFSLLLRSVGALCSEPCPIGSSSLTLARAAEQSGRAIGFWAERYTRVAG